MKDSLKKLKTKNWLLIGSVVLLILSILLITNEFWIKVNYNRIYVFSSFIIQLISSLTFTFISALIILFFVEKKFKEFDEERTFLFYEDFLKNIEKKNREHIDLINKDLFKGIYGLSVEKDILLVLEKELFKKDTIRRNLHISISFTIEKRNKNRFVKEMISMSYDLENKSDKDIIYPFKFSTTDRDKKCIIIEQQISKGGQLLKKNTPDLIPDSDISKHTYNYEIKAKEKLEITTMFSLDFGIHDDHYQNTIGIKEFAVGKTLITIKKPKGYLFTLELYCAEENELINDPKFDDNINEESLTYKYSNVIFPGAGLEYTLEKKH